MADVATIDREGLAGFGARVPVMPISRTPRGARLSAALPANASFASSM